MEPVPRHQCLIYDGPLTGIAAVEMDRNPKVDAALTRLLQPQGLD
jgi:hypothetical protein